MPTHNFEPFSKVRPTFWVGKKYLWCAKGSGPFSNVLRLRLSSMFQASFL